MTDSFDQVRVRFAPSPTGFLHIGGARTALFNYLFAKNKGGKFLLRIEDTDQKRSTKEAIDAILDGLNWLGLVPSEKPIFQSNNISRHQKIAEELVKKGKAYKCYESSENLAKLRVDAEKKGEVFRFQSPWRNENFSGKKPSQAPVIRLRAPRNKEFIINDLVQGEVKVNSNEIDDLVILRADKTPTYMLAVVVDDIDMKISHIIRGDDHLTNSFKQKAIYEALDLETPAFSHIPLIYGPDGAKMSKRHGATSVVDYKEMGYLPEAMRNYLLRLGFSDGDREIINDKEAIQIFDFKKVGKSPSRFNFDKLNSLNKYYIKEKTNEELFEIIEELLLKIKFGNKAKLISEAPHGQEISQSERERIIKALSFLKEKPATLNEIANSCETYFDNYLEKFLENKDKYFDTQHLELISSKYDLLMQIKKTLGEVKDWNYNLIKECLMNFAKENNIKIKDFGPALRLVLTFSSSSAGGIFNVVDALGQKEAITRIEENSINNN